MKGEVSAEATEAAPGIGGEIGGNRRGKLGRLHRRHVGGGELDSIGRCRKLR